MLCSNHSLGIQIYPPHARYNTLQISIVWWVSQCWWPRAVGSSIPLLIMLIIETMNSRVFRSNVSFQHIYEWDPPFLCMGFDWSMGFKWRGIFTEALLANTHLSILYITSTNIHPRCIGSSICSSSIFPYRVPIYWYFLWGTEPGTVQPKSSWFLCGNYPPALLKMKHSTLYGM